MPDQTPQTLDEILFSFANYIKHHQKTGLGGGGMPQDEAKQALTKLIADREREARIDENHNWLRHIGPAWDAEGVLADDVHDRLAKLRKKGDK